MKDLQYITKFGDSTSFLNKETIIYFLELLNEELIKKNVSGEISMVGGAVMCLCFGARVSTRDIDAIFEPKMIIYDCVKNIAMKCGLPEDWLNDGVKGFLSRDATFKVYREMSNLRIFVASPEYMLAMKCLSSRLDNLDELEDIKFLVKYLELTSLEQVIEIITKYYPIRMFLPKVQYTIMEILESYE
ncbi:MAG: DUF6036 family nucleotidyltransferase [Marinilabiliaceae bacterium]|nr:DUF6036 family nucleotidyltransferase [Marinilabiliaceae bacterium]